MNWLYLAILSHFLFAVVFALDKVLIKKIISPLKYALIVGAFEGLVVVLIPFVDFVLPQNSIILLALLSGLCLGVGLYFYFKTLLNNEASWVAPFLFGALIPIATYIFSRIFLNEVLTLFQAFAFILLLAGGFVISFSRQYKLSSIFYLIVSAVFVSLGFVFLKIVFNNTNFISGYILSRLGGFLVATIIYFVVYGRGLKFKQIFEAKSRFEKGKKFIWEFIWNQLSGLVALKQFLAFVANIILLYAVSIGNLTLINGLGGIRYAFLIILAAFMARKWPNLMDEKLSFWMILRKSIAVLLIIIGVLILLIKPSQTTGAKIWGADFSSLYANQLGLDSRQALLEIIDDLKIRDFRLNAHWSEIEKNENNYDFSELDFQIDEIEASGGKIILAVGKRLPRWPECHEPEWVKNYETENKNSALLKYIEITIDRYKNRKAIWAWQVENEPFLWGFGECPRTDDEFFDKEISLVKGLDNTRPIIITDSGEFGFWHRAYKRADIFGTTMYRVVYSNLLGDYLKYPIGPDYFKTKAAIMENLFGKKEIINIELQAEPWLQKRPPDVPLEEQLKVFSLSQLQENIEYAKAVGFEKNYLWGIEWAYWMKEKQNHPEFWEEAKKLFD
ncbi:MAG: beta-galactosidase [Patescibacteria group bacterium]